jgi:hypothetical protein
MLKNFYLVLTIISILMAILFGLVKIINNQNKMISILNSNIIIEYEN